MALTFDPFYGPMADTIRGDISAAVNARAALDQSTFEKNKLAYAAAPRGTQPALNVSTGQLGAYIWDAVYQNKSHVMVLRLRIANALCSPPGTMVTTFFSASNFGVPTAGTANAGDY